jgi:hypothetical protein
MTTSKSYDNSNLLRPYSKDSVDQDIVVAVVVIHEILHWSMFQKWWCNVVGLCDIKCRIIPRYSALLDECNANIVQYPYVFFD